MEAFNWGEWSLVRRRFRPLTMRISKASILYNMETPYMEWNGSRRRVLEPDNIPLKRKSFPNSSFLCIIIFSLCLFSSQRWKFSMTLWVCFRLSLSLSLSLSLTLICVSPKSFAYLQGGKRERGKEREREMDGEEVLMWL